MSVCKGHRYCRTPYGFSQSPYLQEITAFVAQACVFEEGQEMIDKLTGATVNAKQIERIGHAYGEMLEAQQEGEADALRPKDDSPHYGMMDGGMVLTREDDWKEMKLARLFKASDILPENNGRNFIRQSQYVAHLGGTQGFFRKLCAHTDHLTNMVWVCDGAKWIWDWVKENYPEAVQILDYYHAKEKLCGFAKELFGGSQEDIQLWVDQQEDLLFSDEVGLVIANIALQPCKGKAKELQRALLTYYENNKGRMMYRAYKEKGLLIGSGPMEAAHRNVIQQRLKLSGQRWTIEGAQQIANLRVAKKSDRWGKVKKLANLN